MGVEQVKIISRVVGPDLAYLVQTEVIRARIAGKAQFSIQDSRTTMLFRREKEGWSQMDRAPACGFANAYAPAAKVVTMDLLDLTPRQLKRAAAIKKRITDSRRQNRLA